MTAARTPLRRVDSHRLPAPTASDFLDALRSVPGGADVDGLWQRLLGCAGVPADEELLGVAEMERLAAALAEEPGLLGLTGRALRTRVATYRELRDHAGVPRPVDWSRRTMELLVRGRAPDVDRLTEIAALDLFSPSSRTRLDRAAADAGSWFGTDEALVTVVLDGSLEFAGRHGVTGWRDRAGGIPVEWALCAVPVRTGRPYVVPDATVDILEQGNPLVEQDGLRSYAGAPLVTSAGHVLGSLCLLHGRPRSYTPAEVAQLQEMADQLVAELERARADRPVAAVG